MKKTSILLIAITFLLTAAAQTVPLANTNLWKLSGNGLNKDSYIFLTGPSCDESLKLTKKAKDALQKVTAIAVEYDLYGSKDANKMATNSITGVDSERIQNNLTGVQINLFSNLLKNAGYPPTAVPEVMKYKLYMANYLIAAIDGPCGLENQSLAFEVELKPLAKKSSKNYILLQSIDEVLKGLNGHSNEFWKRGIEYILNNDDKVKLDLANEANWYKNENILALKKLYNNPTFKLLYGNASHQLQINLLVERIAKQAQSAPTFISIQLTNIIYDDCSVFEELTKKGFKISPITQ